MSELNEGRHQVKRKYGEHGRIRINENGAKVRETIIKYVGKNYVTEEDLHNHLIRLEEDRGGVKVNKAKWFARNQKLFTTFEKRGTTYYSLSKYGRRVLELINSKTMKKAINESTFKNIPSLSEWIAVNESEINEAKKPKSWDTMFAMNAIKAYQNGEFNLDDKDSILAWDTEYNGGRAPKPAFDTKEIVDYAIKTGKKPDGSKMEESLSEAKMAETAHMKEMYEMMKEMYEMMEKMHEGEHEMKATSEMYEKMCEMYEMMKETYEGYGK